MSKSIKKQPRGFTLIELLIYMSIATAAILVFTSFMVDVTKSAARIKTAKEVQQNARLVFSRITQEIRNAKQVPYVNLAGTELTIDNKSRFYLKSDGVYYDDDIYVAPAEKPLTNAEVKLVLVDNYGVTQSEFKLESESIFIKLTVEQKNSNAQGAEKSQISLSSTIVPRSSLY